ncbi:MAG TPA: hypothetical protein VLM42_09400 [Bryobacteraceae bacterium]|nr:hypothetical protein [Bryobacteraceae bacterium]
MGLFRQIARVLIVLLVLVSFTAVQSASAMEIQPDHHGADDRCCAGGHAGHFPALHTVSTLQLGALALAVWHTPAEVSPYTSGDGRTFNSSRAPPA